MTTSSNKLFIQKIAKVCELLDDLSIEQSRITGIVKNQENLEDIKKLLEEAESIEDDLSHDIQNLKVTFYKVEGIFKNFQKLLSDSNYRRTLPVDNFYFIDNKQAFYSDEESLYFDKYINLIKLYKFLESKADHKSSELGCYSLIFLGSKKLIITDEYTEQDLIEIKNLDIFISKFLIDESIQGVSNKEKDQIFRKTLVNFFKDCEVVRFSQIIQDFSKLNNYINDELDIYMSKFSYDDIKKEVEKEKVDFTIRLNKVFSDIQTQLIGVPVSVILAADKLKIGTAALTDPNKFIGMSLTNLLVILAISFYAIVLAMLIRNQNNTLEALKDEIDHHESLFNSKHKGMAQKFKKSFSQIKNRYEHQKKMLLWVDILVCIAFGTIYLIAYTSSLSNLDVLLPIMAGCLLIGIVFYYRQYE